MKAEQPIAETDHTTFRQVCRVRCAIRATPHAIWALLTDAPRFTSWNTTVTSLEGEIALGNKLALRVKLDPKRTFKPKVTKLEPAKTMEWSDGFAPMFRGVRTFTLTPREDGLTEFEMQEAFSGAMLPMIRKSLPDFGPAFETFASDLKRAAEVESFVTTELRYLLFTSLLTGCLWIPVVVGYVWSRGPLQPIDYKIAPTSPLPHWVNRANRAHINAVESLAPFAAVVLIGQAVSVSSGASALAAAIFFFARLTHAVLHISGFSRFMARTVVFSVGWAAFMVFAVEVLRRAT